MRMNRDFAFFDHPVGRFAIPEAYFDELRRDHLKLMPYLPAALVGAPPSWTSRCLNGFASLGPFLLLAGALLLGVDVLKSLRGNEPRAGAA